MVTTGLPQWLSSKRSSCNAGEAGDTGSVPEWGRSPGGGNNNPFQYSCQKKSHRQRRLEVYTPQGCKEADMTEQLSTPKCMVTTK